MGFSQLLMPFTKLLMTFSQLLKGSLQLLTESPWASKDCSCLVNNEDVPESRRNKIYQNLGDSTDNPTKP